MRTMTWEEIDKDWGIVKDRCKTFVAQSEAEAFARYCIGHSITEVAKRLDVSQSTMQERLDLYAVSVAIRGDRQSVPPSEMSVRDIRKIKEQFSPEIEVIMESVPGGGGRKRIAEITGKDADAIAPYVEHYQAMGHEDSVAIRLAQTEWAAESAVEAGVIKEDNNKNNDRVNKILFPEDSSDTFDLDLKMHMARVQSAASFLDQAKINFLRRKSTCEKVAAANEKWAEQAERILNLHPTFDKG